MDIPKFNFKFKPVKPKRTNTNSFKRKSNKIHKGLCVLEDGEYKCRVEIDDSSTLVLPFTERSYNCKYKKHIFTKGLDEHGNHVHIIRDESTARFFDVDPNIYIPFMKNYIVKGYVVTENGKLYFDFVDIVNLRGYEPRYHYD